MGTKENERLMSVIEITRLEEQMRRDSVPCHKNYDKETNNCRYWSV